MPIQIVHSDITKMNVDAIVNSADNSLLGGGRVYEAIHRAAGPELLAECEALGGCATGSAKLTGAGRLPCKYVIHTAGPAWQDGEHDERGLLVSCYRACLELAEAYGCRTVAFPLISAGANGFPKDLAFRIAGNAVSYYLNDDDMTVYFVVFDKADYLIDDGLFSEIAACIDRQYGKGPTAFAAWRRNVSKSLQRGAARAADLLRAARRRRKKPSKVPKETLKPKKDDVAPPPPSDITPPPPKEASRPEKGDIAPPAAWDGFQPPETYASQAQAPINPSQAFYMPYDIPDLRESLKQLDEGFSQTLMRLIDLKHMTDVQCYKKANISRKLFSKIRSNPTYRPSKPTALAFAVALELSLDETKALLEKAGFALSRSSKFDIIVAFFIDRGEYNIFTINEMLFAYDQSLLGS